MPYDGWLFAYLSPSSGNWVQWWFGGPGNDCPGSRFYGPPPSGFSDYTNGTATNCVEAGTYQTVSRSLHAGIAPENGLEARGPIEDYSNQSYTKTSPAPTNPGVTTVTQSTRAQLESGDYPTLNQELEFQLGTPNVCDPVETFVCNPPPGSTDEQDQRCELSTPGGHDPDPSRGVALDSSPLYETVQTFTRQTADGGQSATALKYGWTLPASTRGWLGWGYRHIYAKHGWGPDDIAATQAALSTTPAPEGTTRLEYTGPEYQQNGAVCVRRVVVSFATERPTEPEPAEIITSYGRYLGEA